MPKITLTIHTASRDDFLVSPHGIGSALATYVACLSQQTLSPADFELVFVDLFWPAHRAVIAALPASFAIKYVPCLHDYWLRRKLVGIASAKNSALLFAEGELVVSCDDAELFPPGLLQQYWNYYEKGEFAHAFHKRLARVGCQEGRLVLPIEGEEYVNDSRSGNVRAGICRHNNGGWLYAGSSFALADALSLNGFNERMDGCKALEDCEFGLRLQMLGRRFVLDPDLFIWILDHPAAYREYLHDVISKENHGYIAANRQFGETRANHRPLRAEELEIIDRETFKFRKFHVDFNSPEAKAWIDYPIFDLAKERQQRLDEWYAGKFR